MSEYTCDGSVPYYEGIYNSLGECIHRDDIKGIISFVCGWCSITCWVFAQIPQIVKSLRLRNVESVSLFFFVNWFVGDISNLVGVLIIGGTTTQIASGIYYMFIDTVSIIENIVFRYFYKSKVVLGESEAARALAKIGIDIGEDDSDAKSLLSSYSSSSYSSDLSSSSLGSDSERLRMLNNNNCITPISPDISSQSDISEKEKQRLIEHSSSQLNMFTRWMFIFATLVFFSFCFADGERPLGRNELSRDIHFRSGSRFRSFKEQARIYVYEHEGDPILIPSVKDCRYALCGEDKIECCVSCPNGPPQGDDTNLKLREEFIRNGYGDSVDEEEHGLGEEENEGGEEMEEELTSQALYITGMVLGYISGVMYLLARVPQSVKICKTKNVFSLAASLFILATFADAFYFVSLVLVTRNNKDLFDYFPWMLGSGGPLIVDILLVVQYYYYINKHKKLPPTHTVDDVSSLQIGDVEGDAKVEGQDGADGNKEGEGKKKRRRRTENRRFVLSSETDNYWRTNTDGTVETYVIGNKVMVFKRHEHSSRSSRASRSDTSTMSQDQSSRGLMDSDLKSDDFLKMSSIPENEYIA